MTTISRTADEIVAWYEANRVIDQYGEIGAQVLTRLPFERAQSYLRPGTTRDIWTKPLAEFEGAGLMSCAVVHAELRGLWPTLENEIAKRHTSCVMRIAHRYAAWLWLLGDAHSADAVLAPIHAAFAAPELLFGPIAVATVDMQRLAAALRDVGQAYGFVQEAHVH